MHFLEIEIDESLLTHPSHYEVMNIDTCNRAAKLDFVGYDKDRGVAVFSTTDCVQPFKGYEGINVIEDEKL